MRRYPRVVLLLLLSAALWASAAAPPAAAQEEVPTDAELLQVQVVFRHGARTPLSPDYLHGDAGRWANCSEAPWTQWQPGRRPPPPPPGVRLAPFFDAGGSGRGAPPLSGGGAPPLPGGCRMGQLTWRGYLQALRLGSRLRERYVDALHLLPAAFDAAAIDAQSTAVQRTAATLQGVLNGLYPEGGGSGAAAAQPVGLRWPEEEVMSGSGASCPALPLLTGALQREQAARDARDARRLRRLSAEVARAASLSLAPGEQLNWGALRDLLQCLRADGRPTPFAKGDEGYAPLVEAMATQRKVEVAAPPAGGADCLGGLRLCEQVGRLSVGRLLGEIGTRLDAAAAAAVPGGTRPARLVLWSGHDTTLLPLLSALGVRRQRVWPGFTSNVVFELWRRRGGSLFVRVLHDGQPVPLWQGRPEAASAGSGGGGGEAARPWTEGLVPAAEFRRRVLDVYALSKRAHGRACRVPAFLAPA